MVWYGIIDKVGFDMVKYNFLKKPDANAPLTSLSCFANSLHTILTSLNASFLGCRGYWIHH